MGSLTNQGENLMSLAMGLQGKTLQSTAQAIVSAPLLCALMSTGPQEQITASSVISGGVAFNGEVTGGSYQRQPLGGTTTPFNVTGDSPFTHANAAAITFTGMPAVTITGFVLLYAASSPNQATSPNTLTDVIWGTFTTPVAVPANGVVVFSPGSLVFTID